MTNRIIAYAIDPYDVTLVFDGPGSKQNIPYGSARLWPTGYIDAEVVRGGGFRVVATEAGEAKVVAHLKHDAHSTPSDYDGLCACCIVLMLASIGEEMVLVIIGKSAIGLYKIHAVAIVALRGLDCY